MPPENTHSKPQYDANSLLQVSRKEFWEASGSRTLLQATAHAAFQSPVDALTQAADQLLGSKILPQVQFTEAPTPASPGSMNWMWQQIGTAVGALPYVILTHGAIRGTLAPRMLGADTQQLLQAGSRLGATACAEVTKLEMASAMLTGFTYAGILSPVDKSYQTSPESFLKGKAINGLLGAGSLASMTASMMGVKHFAGKLSEGTLKQHLSSDIIAATAAGVPSGILFAQAESLVHRQKFASMEETGAQVLASSIISAGFLTFRQPLKTFGDAQQNDTASLAKHIDGLKTKQIDQLLANKAEPNVKPSEKVFSPAEQEMIKQWKSQQDKLTPTNFRETDPQLIKQIADDIYGFGAPQRERQLHCLLGNCGAGKSYVTNKLIKEIGAMNPDSDVIKARIPGYNGGIGNQAVHLDSQAIYKMVQDKAFQAGDNLIIQVTGRSKASIIDLLETANSHGYSTVLHMIDVAPEVSARRVFVRAHEVQPETGIRQMIPPTLPLTPEYSYNPRRNYFQVIAESARRHQQGDRPLLDGYRLWHSSRRESSVLPASALASANGQDSGTRSKSAQSGWISYPSNYH